MTYTQLLNTHADGFKLQIQQNLGQMKKNALLYFIFSLYVIYVHIVEYSLNHNRFLSQGEFNETIVEQVQ